MVYKAVVKVYKAKASAGRWTDTGIVGAAVLLIDRYLKGAAIIRVYDLEVNSFPHKTNTTWKSLVGNKYKIEIQN